MRTIDPEAWYTNVKGTPAPRKLFGIQSMTVIENCLRASFTEAMTDLWANCSTSGTKYIRESTMPKKIRRSYLAFIALLTVLGVVALVRSGEQFRLAPPLLVSLVSSQHPARLVDFPAVALCSNNAVSRRALRKYAGYLYALDVNSTYSLEHIERNLRTFGALATWQGSAADASFMEYLSRVAHQTNVTDVIMKLTPQCSSFLKRCAWRTARVPCERLFALRPTPHGYCCVFNSRYQEEDLYNPAQRLQLAGQDNGLSVVVKEDDSDVAFYKGPEEGIQVLLFDGNEYPLIEGGSSKVFLMQRNTSAYMKLRATTQYTASDLHYYSEERRGCRMRHLRSREVSLRSQAWCLAACRRRTVRALCGCVPHLMFPSDMDTVCSPDQLACLNKHKEKFTNFYPGDFAHPSLNEESSDSMFCEDCLPDCTRLTYAAAVSYAAHQHTTKLFLNFFVNGISLINTTVIRIYYASEEQMLYVVETNRHWYEITSVLISQWQCVVAVTLVSLAELLYHLTVRWRHHYMRRRRSHATRKQQLTPSVRQ